jgi:hypothetical protein
VTAALKTNATVIASAISVIMPGQPVLQLVERALQEDQPP